MKSTKNVKLFLLVFLTGILLISNKNTFRKMGSVTEFLNDLFLSNGEDTSESEVEALYNRATNPESSIKKSNLLRGTSIEGWLKIKSLDFKNKNKYTPIIIESKKFPIEITQENFRINQSYDGKKSDGEELPKSNTDFYFTLVKNLIGYSLNKKDKNVIGTIEVTQVQESKISFSGAISDDLCFSIKDSGMFEYQLCAENSELRNTWICKINIGIGKYTKEDQCSGKSSQNDNKDNFNTVEKTVVKPMIIIPLPSRDCNQDWGYDNQGRDWECGCAEGFEQSPIDIPDKSGVITSPVSPLFTFDVVSAKSQNSSIDGELKAQEFIKIKYFKNAIRILHSNLGKVVTLDGSVYIGEEIVFHTPSEHKINGKTFDMEMQIIFYGQSKGDIAKQVILSFLFEKKPGVYNKFLDDIDFFSLPNSSNPERELLHDLYIPKIFHRSSEESGETFKPFSFYSYQGSLTMPPCTEGTIHYVVADPIPLASVPIQLFQEAIRKNDLDNFEYNNNRKIQPLNGRPIFFFDRLKYGISDIQAETNKAPKKPEKTKNRVDDYVFINDNTPSGLPGSFNLGEK